MVKLNKMVKMTTEEIGKLYGVKASDKAKIETYPAPSRKVWKRFINKILKNLKNK